MNRLNGSIPDLSRLTSLILLYAANNEFRGPFPSSIVHLPFLSALDLSGHVFSGSVPIFNSSAFPSLFILSLENTGLTGISSFCDVPVVDIDVSFNNIGFLDLCAGSMKYLRSLDLSGNQLFEIDVLPLGLLELRLVNAGLQSIPAAVGVLSFRLIESQSNAYVDNMSPLQHLDLSQNGELVLETAIAFLYVPSTGNEWVSIGEAKTGTVSTLGLLESLQLSDTGTEMIPMQWLPASLCTLLVSGSDHLDISGLILGGARRARQS